MAVTTKNIFSASTAQGSQSRLSGVVCPQPAFHSVPQGGQMGLCPARDAEEIQRSY